ncbi:MAG: hypothetical protein OEZ34_16285, partial [Spirochaetia bacterium]|nr:hypothetical protein [Spirochaetia bacterium]
YPDEKLSFVLGSDAFRSFSHWKNPSEILRSHPLFVLKRNHDDAGLLLEITEELIEKFPEVTPEIRFLENPQINCSSSEIREKILDGGVQLRKELDECLQESAVDYILSKNLYVQSI